MLGTILGWLFIVLLFSMVILEIIATVKRIKATNEINNLCTKWKDESYLFNVEGKDGKKHKVYAVDNGSLMFYENGYWFRANINDYKPVSEQI